MKTVISPEYSALADFIGTIPSSSYENERNIRANRNVLGHFTAEGHDMVIKRYKRPTLFNCVVYTFFRKSKCHRAYDNAFKLKAAGFHTADPIAYIEVKKVGMFHTGYFISKHVDLPLLSDFYTHDEQTREQLLDDFIAFTVRLHEAGIIHQDFNLSNIFYFRDGDHYDFCLIDINRMSFGTKSHKKILRSFETLTFKDWTCVEIMEKYALARGWQPEGNAAVVLFRKGNNIFIRSKKAVKSLWRRMIGPAVSN